MSILVDTAAMQRQSSCSTNDEGFERIVRESGWE